MDFSIRNIELILHNFIRNHHTDFEINRTIKTKRAISYEYNDAAERPTLIIEILAIKKIL